MRPLSLPCLRSLAALAVSMAVTGLVAATPGLARSNKHKEVEVANLNLNHGIDCDPAFPDVGDQCRLADRIDLLVAHLVERGCPDVVTLQEIVDREFVARSATEIVGPLDSSRQLIEERIPDLADACGFTYEVVYSPLDGTVFQGTDEELVLSRYPVLDSEIRPLHSALFPPAIPPLQFFARHALFVRIDHPVGPIDIFTTHLASAADFGNNACNSLVDFGGGFVVFVPCPVECELAQTVRECQARQLALFVEERHDVATPAWVTGDLNAPPGSAVYEEFAGRGWIDSHLAAGNPECDAATGGGCTSGRDAGAGDLEAAELNLGTRIDYAFLVPAQLELNCRLVRARPRRSGLFAAEANPFAPVCGAPPLPVCWTSDHSGSYGSVRCP